MQEQTQTLKRVLVLNANQRSTLAVVRSLGEKHVPLFTADESASSLAGNSRYSCQYFRYPSPQQMPAEFCQCIEEICISHNIDIVIPMTELTSTLLLSRENKHHTITLPFPEMETVDALADKCELIRTAETLGIPVPATWHADNPDKLPLDLNEVTYPLVLKPGKSWVKYNGRWIHTTVQIACNAAQAKEILDTDEAYRAHPFMLQEFLPGRGGGIFALYEKGRPLAFFAHRRLREKPPRGGISVLSESAPLDTELESYARKLLDHVHWHGVAMVEFRITPDGKPYLMEINTRFWGSLQLAVNAGVDFPWLLYQITCGKQVAAVTRYRTGIRLRWWLGNLDWLYLTLRDNEFSKRKKLQALAAFFRPSPFKTRHEVIRWSDIKPFWWELKQYVRDILS